MNLSTETSNPVKPADRLDWRIEFYDRCRTNPCGWYRWAFGHIVARYDAHVMDFGCGTARVWSVNRDRIPAGWHVFLCDASRDMANRVQRTVLPLPCSAAAIIADVGSLPFPDGSLDAILAMHVLHLVPDVQAALREFQRVLKRNGRLYATAGSLLRLKHLEALGASCTPPVKVLLKDPRERFCAEHGREILMHGRFRDVREVEYKDSIEFQDLDTLIRYIRTTDGVSAAALEPPAIDAFVPFLQAILQEEGHITIRNDAALFEARI